MSGGSAGRLTQPVNAELFELLYEPQLRSDRRDVLPHLVAIDAAHLLMLARCGLLAPATAAALLEVNRSLAAGVAAGDDGLGQPGTHRGLYLLYERAYVERLGEEVGGAAHLGRSRNDINAAVARLRARTSLAELLDEACALLSALGARIEAEAETVLCGFTHQQPAQPTTLGHYLAGVAHEALRSAEWLERALAETDRSPLGAAAGFGTPQPIDRELVAELLGFGGVVDNAAEAVASRDYAVAALSASASLGMTLTRLATDLQAWAAPAYGFVDWPDALVSTSSIMPQKRNPFVLEALRGRASQAAGALTALLTGLKNVPFANSVEVSQEAMVAVWPALASSTVAVRLARLLVAELRTCPEAMAAALGASAATLTAVADFLVARHGLAFRQAHEALGRLAREMPPPLRAAALGPRLEAILADTAGRRVAIAEDELARCLDPRSCVEAAAYGGGPAPSVVRAQAAALHERRRALAARLAARRGTWERADGRLRRMAAEAGAVTFARSER